MPGAVFEHGRGADDCADGCGSACARAEAGGGEELFYPPICGGLIFFVHKEYDRTLVTNQQPESRGETDEIHDSFSDCDAACGS